MEAFWAAFMAVLQVVAGVLALFVLVKINLTLDAWNGNEPPEVVEAETVEVVDLMESDNVESSCDVGYAVPDEPSRPGPGRRAVRR